MTIIERWRQLPHGQIQFHDAAVTDGGLTVDNRNRPWTGEDDRRLLD
jgi:hypothetical protein